MVAEKVSPVGATGAAPTAVGAPLKEQIADIIRDTLSQIVAWCPGPIAVDSAAETLAVAIVDILKRHVEGRRHQIREVLELLTQDVYLSGCHMGIEKGEYVDRIVETVLEGL